MTLSKKCKHYTQNLRWICEDCGRMLPLTKEENAVLDDI